MILSKKTFSTHAQRKRSNLFLIHEKARIEPLHGEVGVSRRVNVGYFGTLRQLTLKERQKSLSFVLFFSTYYNIARTLSTQIVEYIAIYADIGFSLTGGSFRAVKDFFYDFPLRKPGTIF